MSALRIFALELKRMWKTRTTWILGGVALILAFAMAFAVISYEEYYYLDENGEETYVSGFKAIAEISEMRETISGEWTPEMIRGAFETYHEVIAEYDDPDGIPNDVFYEKIYPLYPILNRVQNVADTASYIPFSEIALEDAEGYYSLREESIKQYILSLYGGNENVLASAEALMDNTETPFIYKYGYGSNASDYLSLLVWLLVIICTIGAAPLFSSDYQTGADDILRCTKHGRRKFAVIKMLSVLLFSVTVFAVSIAIYTLIVNTAYGWGSLDTSLQTFYSLILAPITVGTAQQLTILGGLLSLLATTCFVMLISAKSNSSAHSITIALVSIFIPIILYTIGGNVFNWLTCLLPTGGVGLGNGFYSRLRGFTFLQAGSISIWAPYVLIVAAAIEIPVFFFCAIRFYNRHKLAS
ncbi:MAG: ABC transporter permease subunit [Clostridia bacterium]|nr:ABC transporter permease subunit [Clostridia bacterium]